MAHIGGVAAIAALVAYLIWRLLVHMTPMRAGTWTVAWILVCFEALPLPGLVLKAWAVWNIDSHPPHPVTEAPLPGMRVAVLIPTYNEPVEVISPDRRLPRARAGARDLGARRRGPPLGGADVRCVRRPLCPP